MYQCEKRLDCHAPGQEKQAVYQLPLIIRKQGERLMQLCVPEFPQHGFPHAPASPADCTSCSATCSRESSLLGMLIMGWRSWLFI